MAGGVLGCLGECARWFPQVGSRTTKLVDAAERAGDTPARRLLSAAHLRDPGHGEQMPHQTPEGRRPGQGSDPGGPGPDRHLPARHDHHPPCPARQRPAKPAGPARRPCTAPTSSGPAPSTARPSPGCSPGPVPGLRAQVRQRPPAPHADRRTASAIPGGNGQGRRLGHDHPGTQARPAPSSPGPETPQTPGDQPA
jgi:hypothetical protein